MQWGKGIDSHYVAYFIQIKKVQIGFFTESRCGLMHFGLDKAPMGLGWSFNFGPFQVCYYKYAQG